MRLPPSETAYGDTCGTPTSSWALMQPVSPQPVLSDDLTEFLSVSGDLTDWPGGAKEHQTVGAPSSRWVRPGCKCAMSYAASVSLPRRPFPVMSDKSHLTGASLTTLSVPFVLDTLQCETPTDNLERQNKSELFIGYKCNDRKLWTSLQMWLELLWTAILFSYPKVLPSDLQDTNNTHAVIPAIPTRRKIQPEISPRGPRPNLSDRTSGKDFYTVQ